MRMPYANAYDIRTEPKAALAGARPGRDRAGLPGFLTAALLHRRHPRARDIRVALSAAGGPRDVRERGDGVRGGADLAGTAPSPPGPVTAASAGSTCSPRSRPPCARWSSARRPRSDRSWPSAMCCWRPCGCGSRSTATSPAVIGGSSPTGATWSSARRLRCPSSPTGFGHRSYSSRCTRCRTAYLVGTRSTFVWFAAGVGAWLGWTIPMYLVHRWLTRTPLIPPSTISQQSDMQSV